MRAACRSRYLPWRKVSSRDQITWIGVPGKLLGHGHDHAHVIAVHAPAEAAADQRLVMVDVLRRHAGLFGGDDQRLQHHGGRMPEIDAVLR